MIHVQGYIAATNPDLKLPFAFDNRFENGEYLVKWIEDWLKQGATAVIVSIRRT